jgi:uncharacterized membrane protein YeaQ/YmgE (transglycosylase-associated protein family)
LGLTSWLRSSSKPVFRNRSYSQDFHANCLERLISTPLTASYLSVDQKCFSIRGHAMSILWTIIIGFVAGVIAKFIMPGENEPTGFVLTAILGIVGAFVATYLGQALGWYSPGQGAGLMGAVVGAIIVLVVYGLIAGGRGRTI